MKAQALLLKGMKAVGKTPRMNQNLPVNPMTAKPRGNVIKKKLGEKTGGNLVQKLKKH